MHTVMERNVSRYLREMSASMGEPEGANGEFVGLLVLVPPGSDSLFKAAVGRHEQVLSNGITCEG